ncbi:MAG: hypothetical protein II352_07280 [Selenomonadaceae bacterium]|nr:hypothetical protein [Selenomonadaceae bacterium]
MKKFQTHGILALVLTFLMAVLLTGCSEESKPVTVKDAATEVSITVPFEIKNAEVPMDKSQFPALIKDMVAKEGSGSNVDVSLISVLYNTPELMKPENVHLVERRHLL